MTKAPAPATPKPSRTRGLKRNTCSPKRVTFAALQQLKPGQKRCDPAVAGLHYRCQAGKGSGRSAVYAVYRWNDPVTGKRREMSLGKVPTTEEWQAELDAYAEERYHAGENPVSVWADPDLALEKFREKARKARGKVLAGLDPSSTVGAEGRTLRQGLDLHIRRMTNKGASPLSIAEYELALTHLSDWANVPLRRLTPMMVQERHERLGKKVGPAAANKTMRMLRAVWNSAWKADPVSGVTNPTAGVAWFNVRPRKSALRTKHLKQWGKELAALRAKGGLASVRADLYALGVMTGLRKASLLKIERDHFDEAGALLRVVAPKGGEGRSFDLPLSREATVLLARRFAATNSKWAFPSEGDPKKHLSDPRALPGEFSAWTDADGKPVGFTIHGLRATFIGAGHAAGVSDRYVMLLANHALHKGDVHGGYVPEDDLHAMRAATQKITEYLRDNGLPL